MRGDDAIAHAPSPGAIGSSTIASSPVACCPLGRGSTSRIVPPRLATISWQIARPRPEPLRASRPDEGLEQAQPQLGAMPGPLSEIVSRAVRSRQGATRTASAARGECLIALWSRLRVQLAQRPLVRHAGAGSVSISKSSALPGDQRREVERDRAHDGIHACSVPVALLAQLLDLGQREHLVGSSGPGSTVAPSSSSACAGATSPRCADCTCVRSTASGVRSLVRGVAHEALLVGQQVGQARHHLVGRVQQRQQLARRVGSRRWAPGRCRCAGAVAPQLPHRPRGALHDEDDDRGDDEHQRRLAPQRVEQDLARQGLAQLEGLGDLDRRHPEPSVPDTGCSSTGHADRLAAVGVVVEVHQCGVGPLTGSVPRHAGRSSKPETISPAKPLTRKNIRLRLSASKASSAE